MSNLTLEEEIFLVLLREDSSAAAVTRDAGGKIGFRVDEEEIHAMYELAKKVTHTIRYGVSKRR